MRTAPHGESCRARGAAEAQRGDGLRGLGNPLLLTIKASPCERHVQPYCFHECSRPVGCGVGRGSVALPEAALQASQAARFQVFLLGHHCFLVSQPQACCLGREWLQQPQLSRLLPDREKEERGRLAQPSSGKGLSRKPHQQLLATLRLLWGHQCLQGRLSNAAFQ